MANTRKTKDCKHLLFPWLNRKKNQNQFKALKLNYNAQLRHVKYRQNDSLLQTQTVKSSLSRAVSLVPFMTPSSEYAHNIKQSKFSAANTVDLHCYMSANVKKHTVHNHSRRALIPYTTEHFLKCFFTSNLRLNCASQKRKQNCLQSE